MVLFQWTTDGWHNAICSKWACNGVVSAASSRGNKPIAQVVSRVHPSIPIVSSGWQTFGLTLELKGTMLLLVFTGEKTTVTQTSEILNIAALFAEGGQWKLHPQRSACVLVVFALCDVLFCTQSCLLQAQCGEHGSTPHNTTKEPSRLSENTSLAAIFKHHKCPSFPGKSEESITYYSSIQYMNPAACGGNSSSVSWTI